MGLVKQSWMEAQERGWNDPDEKFVCPVCVEDDYLKEIIRLNAETCQCDYCGAETDSPSAAPILCLMEPVASTVYYFYGEPAQVGVPWAEGAYVFDTFCTTADVLLSIDLECHDELFQDIENAFINDVWAEAAQGHWASSHPHEDLLDSWSRFVEIVKHEIRYFFQGVSSAEPDDYESGRYDPRYLLPAIGSFVEELELIRNVSAGTPLFRVRERFETDGWENDAGNLGAPPSNLARAGRMNPAGISYLYLALDKQTALAEVLGGPPCKAVIASFEASRDLRILDLSDLPPLPSIFDGNQRWERERLLFLRHFVKEISRPVRKDGHEHIDYVPSQVVSEYFAQVHRVSSNQRLDGIVYPSAVRPGGVNIVIFPRNNFRTEEKFDGVAFVSARENDFKDWSELASEII